MGMSGTPRSYFVWPGPEASAKGPVEATALVLGRLEKVVGRMSKTLRDYLSTIARDTGGSAEALEGADHVTRTMFDPAMPRMLEGIPITGSRIDPVVGDEIIGHPVWTGDVYTDALRDNGKIAGIAYPLDTRQSAALQTWMEKRSYYADFSRKVDNDAIEPYKLNVRQERVRVMRNLLGQRIGVSREREWARWMDTSDWNLQDSVSVTIPDVSDISSLPYHDRGTAGEIPIFAENVDGKFRVQADMVNNTHGNSADGTTLALEPREFAQLVAHNPNFQQALENFPEARIVMLSGPIAGPGGPAEEFAHALHNEHGVHRTVDAATGIQVMPIGDESYYVPRSGGIGVAETTNEAGDVQPLFRSFTPEPFTPEQG